MRTEGRGGGGASSGRGRTPVEDSTARHPEIRNAGTGAREESARTSRVAHVRRSLAGRRDGFGYAPAPRSARAEWRGESRGARRVNGRSEAARNSREPIAKCAAGAVIEPACPPRAAVAFLTDEQGKVPSTAGALARAPPQSGRRDARRARRSDESRTLSSVEGVPRSRRHARDRGRAPGGARGSRESAEAVRRRCRKDSCFSCARSGGTTMRVTPPKKRVDTVRLSPAVDERDPRPPPRRDPPFNRAIRPPPTLLDLASAASAMT